MKLFFSVLNVLRCVIYHCFVISLNSDQSVWRTCPATE